MKRASFALVILSLAIAFSCTSKPESKLSESIAPFGATRVVDINFTYTLGTPPQFKIEGNNLDEVYLSMKALHKVRWHVNHKAGTVPVSVTVDNFMNVDDASDKDPFGPDHDANNVFTTAAVAAGDSKDSKESDVPTKKGRYKYRITLTLAGVAQIVLDPVVVVGD